MVRRKNVLATMMHSMAALAVVGIFWVAVGYGLAFGPSKISLPFLFDGGGVIGWHPDLFFLRGINPDRMLAGNKITVYAHVMFQGMFAIITPALISGAIAERIRFWPFCIFMILWVTLVYCPLAHMVWAMDWFADDPLDEKKGLGGSPIGLLGKMGALDFAGGTVVHVAAGTAGLAAALVLRRRIGYPEHAMHPNSMVLTLLGAGLLWFGWFGFNGGSALNGTSLAVSAFSATQAAAAAAGLSWIFVEWLFRGKPTALGLASGIVAGLVAVTPASGFVYIWGGLLIGLLAGVVCYFTVYLKSKIGYDDSLDAFGVHAVGGFLGAVLTGFFTYTAVNSNGADGFFAIRSESARVEALEKSITDAEAKLSGFQNEALERRKNDLDSKKKELAALKESVETHEKDNKTPMSQPIIQLKAAAFSMAFAFVVSMALTILVQVMSLGTFTTDPKSETMGLDQTEHGETGFDFALGTEAIALSTAPAPRSAKVPPTGAGRFELVVDGVENGGLMAAWSAMCQPGAEPPEPEFKAVYPHLTTVKGNRFHFRGGDPTTMSASLQKLFQKAIPGAAIQVRVVS
jgi:ammonium transporter